MTPALAIGWHFQRRHRWGLAALAAYFAVMAAIKLAVVALGVRISLDTPQSFAAFVVVPMTATFIYFLAVFSFGLDGDLAGRQSTYPPRLFTLPLSNRALAGWPMLYGTAAMLVLWLAARVAVVWPHDARVPAIWPALLAASLLAWTQALTWMPYGLRGLRVIVTVLWLAAIDAIVLIALDVHARETIMLALLAPHLPLAFVTARSAVARARRGDVPAWDREYRPTGTRNAAFRSAASAQAWFEWRRHGRSLPAFVALLLPFEAALLWIFRDTPALVYEALAIALVTPAFAAGFVAATVSRASSADDRARGLSPFLATRPLSTVSMVGASLDATVRSTAVAWLLTLVTLPMALLLSGTFPLVVERARATSAVFGSARTIVLATSGCAALMLWTWKRLVQGLYIGLTGREWLIKGYVFVTLALLTAAGPIVVWIGRDRALQGAIWDALPSILSVLVVAKMSAGIFIVVRLWTARVVAERTMVTVAAAWSAAVFTIYGVMVWFVDTEFVPHYVLMLAAILAVPLVRLSAAPLALASNRHR